MLTTAQLQTIKADIANNGDLVANPNTSDGNQAVANLYNALQYSHLFQPSASYSNKAVESSEYAGGSRYG